mgnify:CR=1 FL=1
MGFFKKIFKGVGKVFKKIGRGIKKVVGKFGKFMNRIGVVGQIAMAFILPGIGNALASGLGSMLGLQGVTGMSTLVGSASASTGLLGSGNALLQGAGKVLQFAGKVASAPGKVFSSITNGVTSTIKEFSKTALSKLAPESALAQGAAESFFFGADSAASRVGTAIKAPFTEKAVLDAVTETADESLTPTVDTSDVVETVTEKTTTPDPLIDQSLMTPSPTPPDMDALAQQKENYVEKTVRNITTTAQETVESKMESLSDPMKVAEAGFKVYSDRQSEEELAAQQAAMFGGDVIDVGIYQDPSAFLTYQAQNTVAPIQSFQPTASYTQPMASWAQQFMYQPDVNVGAFANTSYNRGF